MSMSRLVVCNSSSASNASYNKRVPNTCPTRVQRVSKPDQTGEAGAMSYEYSDQCTTSCLNSDAVLSCPNHGLSDLVLFCGLVTLRAKPMSSSCFSSAWYLAMITACLISCDRAQRAGKKACWPGHKRRPMKIQCIRG